MILQGDIAAEWLLPTAGREARDVVKHPTVYKTVLSTKKYSAKNVNKVEVEKL